MWLRGGAALKRPKVKMSHMAPKADDHDEVKGCFAIKEFKAELWLKSLDKENEIKTICVFSFDLFLIVYRRL